MRRIFLFSIVFSAFVFGIGVTLLIGHYASRSPAATSAGGAADGKKVLYWYDPMAPQQHFDQPGKSPYMDMQLVPKVAGESVEAAGTVVVDPRQVQDLGLRTALAQRGALATSVRATGVVAFDERAVTVVQSRVAGIVEQLLVRAPLTAVKQGQALLTLIAPDWTAAQEEYLALRRAHSEGLEPLKNAARQRLILLGMDDAQIRAIERSGQGQTRITIAAPRSGVVGELNVREGATVMAGAPLLRLNGLDTVWVNASIAEAQSGRVTAGAAVKVELSAFPGETFSGTVEALLPELDATTRTQIARIVLPNPLQRIAPGMYARVEIAHSAPATDTVLIPTEAVIATGLRQVVIVDEGRGRFRAQQVRAGGEGHGKTAILQGLKDGERVVLSGQYLIDSEASLTGALARLSGGDPLSSTPAPMTKPDGGDAPTAQRMHLATGVVQKVDSHRLTIDTDAIASLNAEPASMTFVCPERIAVDAIRQGQRVSFSFVRNAGNEFEIVKIAVVDGTESPSSSMPPKGGMP